ncbi:MAG: TrkH family potassium uptake protein, partial [Candidatus Hydrogenedentota bacterium]
MNYRLLAKYLGLLAVALGLVQLIPIIWAIHFGEISSIFALGGGAVVSLAAGGLLYLVGRNASPRMLQREALALVGLGWILVCLFGSGPFILSGLLDPVDGFFESASGFTTTGATVMTDIEAATASILFYRQMTQWLGGVGIIVLFVAVLPYLGAGGKQIFKSEVTGPDPRGLTPRIRDSARMLFSLYIAFSIAQTVAYMIAGLSFYHALCHMMGSLSTGGFSPHQASIGHYDSVAVESITIVFMFLGGTSFSLYFAMMRGNRLALFKDTEWRVYIGILVAAILLMAVNLVFPHSMFTTESGSSGGEGIGFGEALRAAGFQAVSIMTTTGFVTEDFDAWPHFSRVTLVLLMFIGGCAGSTGGGVKVVRIVLLCKMIHARPERTFRP